MPKHTPGPWSYVPEKLILHEGKWHHAAGRGPKVLDANSNEIARLFGGTGTNAEANARLIAAAPDLLATLRLIANHSSDPVTASEARAAVARVEGKP